MRIEYATEADLTIAEFLDLLQRSTLAQRRPVEDLPTIRAMLCGASLIITARAVAGDGKGLLVGVSRAVTDFAYCTYLSDLAVDVTFQRQGIGKQLIERTHDAAGKATTLILLSAPQASSYYPHIGMLQHDSCWIQPGCQHIASTGSHTQAPPRHRAAPSTAIEPSADPAAPRVGAFFDSLAADYNQAIHRCFPGYSEMLKVLISYLPPALHAPQILELGCGTGNLSQQIAAHYPDCAMTLVDLSADSLAACRRRLGDARAFRYCHRDMRQLEFEPKMFDLIVSTIAIHHLTSVEKQALFEDCHRWLRPGGTFCFADQFSAESEANYTQHMRAWKQMSLAAGASSDEWDAWMAHQREHDHHDTLSDQLGWLAAAGFRQADALWRYLLWTIVQTQNAPP